MSCTDLSFGTITFGDMTETSVTVAVDPDTAEVTASGAASVSLSGGAPAECTVTGSSAGSVQVFIDGAIVGGATSIIVPMAGSGPEQSLEAVAFALDGFNPVGVSGGTASFFIGAEVAIPSGLTADDLGAYSGTMNVSVQEQ
ncbi:DUF4402 domain-containing protein [Pseudohaliea rubra]|uniref:DUF4402 domain-containing protein n=1 Tax=Pseudohaliea rubra TaxID=475795 RepID=UPI0005592606|nr:DUF4402 domain-containing protein [Pseudohaliea rubra]